MSFTPEDVERAANTDVVKYAARQSGYMSTEIARAVLNEFEPDYAKRVRANTMRFYANVLNKSADAIEAGVSQDNLEAWDGVEGDADKR